MIFSTRETNKQIETNNDNKDNPNIISDDETDGLKLSTIIVRKSKGDGEYPFKTNIEKYKTLDKYIIITITIEKTGEFNPDYNYSLIFTTPKSGVVMKVVDLDDSMKIVRKYKNISGWYEGFMVDVNK